MPRTMVTIVASGYRVRKFMCLQSENHFQCIHTLLLESAMNMDFSEKPNTNGSIIIMSSIEHKQNGRSQTRKLLCVRRADPLRGMHTQTHYSPSLRKRNSTRKTFNNASSHVAQIIRGFYIFLKTHQEKTLLRL